MYPEDLRYSREHTWIRVKGDKGRIGITYFAQAELGDIVFVELPALGRWVRQLEAFGVVESVKAVSDLHAPASGEVVEVNSNLEAQPELINSDPYGAGWIAVIRLGALQELENLMSAQAYRAFVEAGGK